jgi:hypothetical protein
VSRDPLRVLLRMRQALLTTSRQDLAQALGRETAAEQALADASATIARECHDCPPEATLAFAEWLPHARMAQRDAASLLRRRNAETTLSRLLLAERHADTDAVEKLLEKRDAAAALAASRREQAAMDEAAGRISHAARASATGQRRQEPPELGW